MKKIAALMLTVMLFISAIPFAVAENINYTWWIPRSEDTSYYDKYAQNPVVRYFLDTKTYDGKSIDIDFWAGLSGAEKDNFNNMLSTGDLADVVDLGYSDYTPAALYEDGYIMDLTDLIPQYMPNYMAHIEQDEEMAEYAWSMVDGEKKLLTIVGFREVVEDPFEGYCYRRDWLVKYGKNPVSGAAFTGGFNADGMWTDDVVFPSGGNNPIYISDWEWMLDIFSTALNDLGIKDGYCISVYYTGYMGTGDLMTGFGGGCPWWYRTADNQIAFGGTSNNMRAYIECMHTWYEKGWLDRRFAEHTGDMFYSIDSTKVHQGKVGMWQGRVSEVGTAMNMNDGGLTDGIMVYGCAQPINDVYGGEEQKDHLPDTYYTYSRMDNLIAFSTRAAQKDIAPLMMFIDQFYGDKENHEASDIASHGFSDVDMASMDKDSYWYQLYAKFGLEAGEYIETEDENGEWFCQIVVTDTLLGNAMKMNRLVRYAYNAHKDYSMEARPQILRDAIKNWKLYENIGYIRDNLEMLLTESQSAKKTKIYNNISTYMSQNVPRFIMGEKGFDISNDKDWGNFTKSLEKYGVSKVVEMYQQALNQMKE